VNIVAHYSVGRLCRLLVGWNTAEINEDGQLNGERESKERFMRVGVKIDHV
jgi:hypothetical protein